MKKSKNIFKNKNKSKNVDVLQRIFHDTTDKNNSEFKNILNDHAFFKFTKSETKIKSKSESDSESDSERDNESQSDSESDSVVEVTNKIKTENINQNTSNIHAVENYSSTVKTHIDNKIIKFHQRIIPQLL